MQQYQGHSQSVPKFRFTRKHFGAKTYVRFLPFYAHSPFAMLGNMLQFRALNIWAPGDASVISDLHWYSQLHAWSQIYSFAGGLLERVRFFIYTIFTSSNEPVQSDQTVGWWDVWVSSQSDAQTNWWSGTLNWKSPRLTCASSWFTPMYPLLRSDCNQKDEEEILHMGRVHAVERD